MMRFEIRILVAACFLVMLGGCYTSRTSSVAMVNDAGSSIVTKYRYRLKSIYCLDETYYMYSGIKLWLNRDARQKTLTTEYPNVFSDEGIQFSIRCKSNKYVSKYFWTQALCICSLAMLPEIHRYENVFPFEIEMAVDGSVRSQFEVMCISEWAGCVSPLAFVPFSGDPDGEGHRIYWRSKTDIGNGPPVGSIPDMWDDTSQQAFAYAVAMKLKELEDSGKIDEMFRSAEAIRPKVPRHRVVRLEREAVNGFMYGFALELAEMPDNPHKAAEVAMREFGESVKKEYQDTYPNVNVATLAVHYSNINVTGKRVEGRVAVLALTPISLSYDANTRRGRLSVKFNTGQAEEARAWIRKNIETLARDKNIALTTGQLPPAATYYSLGEKIDGDIMEIEFRTE